MDFFSELINRNPELGFQAIKFMHVWLLGMPVFDLDLDTEGELRFSTINMVKSKLNK